jgi:pimeloyl-ACP methyl ester carboxylesterase
MTAGLLCIPDLMCDGRIFQPQMNALGQERLVTLALPTRGAQVEDMAQIVLAEAPAQFALLGQGLGGVVALEVLRRAPERVSHLALIACDPLAEPPPLAAAREARMVSARAGRLSQALAEEYPPECISPPWQERLQRQLVAMWQGLGAECFFRQSRAMQRRPDHQRTLRQARLPALVLGGAEDPIVPARRQDFAAGLLPYGEYHSLPGAGHFPTLEAAEAVNAALVALLARPALF